MDTYTKILITALAAIASAALGRALWEKFITVVIVPMNHRSIHSRDGKFVRLLVPGKYRFTGTGHGFQSFDDRLQQLALQTQELTTSEGITVKVTAIGLYRVADPLVAISATADYVATLYTLIQLALRDAIGGAAAEFILSDARAMGPRLLEVVHAKAEGLGLEVTELVIRDIILPADIKAALSEAWRSRKSALAELEAARGKAAAARTLANAAKLYETNPSLLKVRYIEALEQAAKGIGNTLVFGLPDENTLKRF